MSIDHLIFFMFLALIAEIVGTIGGFGSSLFFIPIASYFLDFHSVLGITAVFHVTSNLTKIALFREGVDWKLILRIGIPATLFVVLGAFLSKYIQTKWLEITLAIFLLFLSVILFIFNKIKLKPSIINAVTGGVFSGFLAGLIGTGGAIRGIVLASFEMSPSVFIATSSFIDLSIDFSRGIVYFFNGFIHSHDLYLIPILAVVSFIGTYLGKKIVVRLTSEQFKKGVLILVFLTGLITLFK